MIVAHNCRGALERCLDAIGKSEQRERIEVLVVDAGSRDGSAEVDEGRPWVDVIRMPMNFGKTRARNIGTRTARGELILFLDPRVEVRPDTVRLLAGQLEAREDAWAATPVLETPEGVQLIHTFLLPGADQLRQASFRLLPLPRTPVLTEMAEAVDEHAFMVRKQVLSGMNYLDEKRFSEHWGLLEVCWQIKNAGKKILVARQARATLHPGGQAPAGDPQYVADSVAGAAAYVAKHYGFAAGLLFRLRCFLAALGSLRLGLGWAILAGRRLDPTQ